MKIHVFRQKIWLGLYADTNFARLFVSEDKSDPVSVNGRTIILLTFGSVSIL